MNSLFPLNNAVFVSSVSSLKDVSGGQQICTQEYLAVIKSAGFSISIVEYNWDQKFLTRLKRRLFPRPYTDSLPLNLVDKILDCVQETNSSFIFLNVVDTAPLAKQLRHKLGDKHKIILLSHGLASVDYLHELRAQGEKHFFQKVNKKNLQKLSLQLITECEQRQYIDYVFCLAPFEVEVERWLGAKRTNWLPRTIPRNSFNWNPDPTRCGFVGTIDHPPNKEGLILFLEEFEKITSNQIHLRLVGGPPKTAKLIAKRFPMVEYLGQLTDSELEKEASTWSCFIHPIFCYARGCSTKLATAIGWQIPIATTSAGCRGYIWNQGDLPLGETPHDLAKLVLKILTDKNYFLSIKKNVAMINQSAPTIDEIASKIQEELSAFII